MSALDSSIDRRLGRWRAPLLSQKKRAAALDDAGQMLERLARSLLARAPAVLVDVIQASHSPVERRGYADIAEIADRAWRFTYLECEIFCVLDEHSQQALLSLIVGGSKSCQLTAIERSIVSESISRLFAVSPQLSPQGFREEPRVRPPAVAWRCNVEICGRGSQTVSLQLFTECPSSPPPAAVRGPNLRGVPLQLRATFPSFACALAEMSSWHSGALLTLRRPGHDATAVLSAGGLRVASGQLGALYGERAVKLLELQASMRP